MNDFMISITRLGSPQTMLLLTFFIIVFLWHHKKVHHLFQFSLFMILGAASVYILKTILHIPRPLGGLITEYGYGFPSGHTTMATIFFLLVAYSYRTHVKKGFQILFVIACLGMIALISYSRVYLGVHTWTDVIGGYALGTFWFLLSLQFYQWLLKAYPSLGEDSFLSEEQ